MIIQFGLSIKENLEKNIGPENQSGKSRIQVIDALRGFAILGIGLTHFIHSFYSTKIIETPSPGFSQRIGHFILELDYRLLESKFFTIFCFLFGISFIIQKKGFEIKKGSFDLWFVKRMIILTFIGLVHYIFWRGDILITYGLFGFLLLGFDHLPRIGYQIILWVCMLSIPTLIFLYYSQSINPIEKLKWIQEKNQTAEMFFKLAREGNFWEVIKGNLEGYQDKIHYLLESGRLFSITGIFLLGAWVGKRGLFENFDNKRSLFIHLFKIVSIVFLISFIGLWIFQKFIKNHPSSRLTVPLNFEINEITNLLQSFLYIISFCLLYYIPFFQKGLKFLEPIGKMALSNYLFQSLIGVLLFYNFGFGLSQKTSIWMNTIMVIPLFALEYYLSLFWLNKFKQGPVESLWKYLSGLNWILIDKK